MYIVHTHNRQLQYTSHEGTLFTIVNLYQWPTNRLIDLLKGFVSDKIINSSKTRWRVDKDEEVQSDLQITTMHQLCCDISGSPTHLFWSNTGNSENVPFRYHMISVDRTPCPAPETQLLHSDESWHQHVYEWKSLGWPLLNLFCWGRSYSSINTHFLKRAQAKTRPSSTFKRDRWLIINRMSYTSYKDLKENKALKE